MDLEIFPNKFSFSIEWKYILYDGEKKRIRKKEKSMSLLQQKYLWSLLLLCFFIID
jgi:hypothetical protein